jgi:hypothetical protein
LKPWSNGAMEKLENWSDGKTGVMESGKEKNGVI